MKKIRYLVEEEDFLGPKGDKLKLTVERGIRPAFLKERKPPRYPAHEALQLLYDALPEIARIWNAVKTLGPLKDNSKEAHKQAALECFDSARRKKWKWITRRALESPAPWEQWRGGKEKGDFRGRLLQELIAERFPKLPNYGAELLEKIARELETDKK